MSDHENINPSGGWNLASNESICAICCNHKPLIFKCPSACVHICSDCMRSHVDTAIGNNLRQIACPCCSTHLTTHRIMTSATTTMYTRYERNISRATKTVASTTTTAMATTTTKQIEKRLGLNDSIYASQPAQSKSTQPTQSKPPLPPRLPPKSKGTGLGICT